ncbi:MAG: class I SAM-dependent methyltransferase [archaeon]
MRKNTPELWDSLWKKTSKEQDIFNLTREENSIRWQRIEKRILSKFKGFKNLRVIEIGAGGGTNALLFAKKGSKVTILDYSKKAIKRSKEFFKRNNCDARFILADALDLPEKLNGKYDVALSFGLAEHFEGKNRIKIVKSHFDLINKGGIALISVPNKYNIPYRIHKFVAESINLWKFGEEYPFSRREFEAIAQKIDVRKKEFIGDSLFTSFRLINPFLVLKKFFNLKSRIRKEKGTPLDSYLSYSLVFVGETNMSTTKGLS